MTEHPNPEPKVYDVPIDDAAQRLGISPYPLRGWCREGIIPARKSQRGYRWMLNDDDITRIGHRDQVVEWLNTPEDSAS